LKKFLIFFLFIFSFSAELFAQSIPAGFPLLEEYIRRTQLRAIDSVSSSFLLRPIYNTDTSLYGITQKFEIPVPGLEVSLLPSLATVRFLSNRPYGWADYGMIPNPGLQTYLSVGIQANYKFINFTFRPEIVIAQNSGFESNLDQMTPAQIQNRFLLWNVGDNPERYGNTTYSRFWWGQSKLTFQYGAFELGGSTQNIWWGPGQFNALTFSNNAQGFPHLTLNTTKPAKTFLGNFEGQLIMGRLENSGFAPAQDQELNSLYFLPFSGDSRYLNAITFTWNPKWVKGFFFGFSRTFQQYNANRGNSFNEWFPIVESFQKINFFTNGNSVDFDADGRDQTVTLFGRP